MTDDRRNDIGSKSMYAIVVVILTLFIHVAWATANSGKDLAHKNEVKIATMEAFIETTKDDIGEIKLLLKRRLP
jgi:cytochrome bd-type quinol oxidase subunit 1